MAEHRSGQRRRALTRQARPASGTAPSGEGQLTALRMPGIADLAATDVGAHRERARTSRLGRLAVLLGAVATVLVLRDLLDPSAGLLPPVHLPSGMGPLVPAIVLIVLLGLVMVVPLAGAGRSPHLLFRPDELDLGFDDVRGADGLVEEVTDTVNLFLAHRAFSQEMGGSPRKAILFEGPPGTGKTYMAKAMAAEAGVPFLFVSSSAFQSMYYGQTNRKIRAYFRALRRYARREGGAIGFIEELDAVGAARGSGPHHGEGVPGVVNELLIQLQSFDQAPAGRRFRGSLVELVNPWLPPGRRLAKPAGTPANILVIGATNRAADLDPALLRPGRFDRSLYFGLPGREGRRDLIDYYLDRKAHDPQLDADERRETLAGMTAGYSPVMIEHLLDEALVWALRRGASRLSWNDVQHAKLTEEIGLAQPVEYTGAERRTIATHEAGHATVAWLVGRGRKLDVLTIVKRKDALGLLSHSDTEERFTKTKSEVRALIEIAFGGMVAEELFFGEASSGVASDLQAATVNACRMVGQLGMGSSLVSAEAIEGGGGIVAKVLSTDGGRDEVEAVLAEAKRAVEGMLEEHRPVVEALRDALIDRRELIGNDILAVIRQASESPGAGAAGEGAGPGDPGAGDSLGRVAVAAAPHPS